MDYQEKRKIVITNHDISFPTQLIFPLLYSISFFFIMLVPPINSQIKLWGEIPAANYLRFVFSFLLSFLLPGYAIIKALFRVRRLPLLELLPFSFLISVLLTALLGVNLFLLSIMHVFLLALSFYTAVRKKTFQVPFEYEISRVDKIILLGTFSLFTLSIASIYSSNWLFMGPDVWRYYGWSLNSMKGVPNLAINPRTFCFFWAAFFNMSGFPTINAWILSTPIWFITVLSFYLMAREYLGKIDKRVPIIATIVWSFFAGFGWIYAIYLSMSSPVSWLEVLKTASNKTSLDIGYPPGYWTFMGDNPPVAIGFVALFMLMYLVKKKDIPRIPQLVFFTFAFVSGFMIHFSEVLIFLAILPLLTVIKKINIIDLLISLISACGFVMIYDYGFQRLFFGSFIMTAYFQYALIILSFSFAGLILTLFINRRRPKFTFSFFQKIIATARANLSLLTLVVVGIIYSFGLSILIWIQIKDSYFWWYTLPYRFLPWYFYPISMGVAGVLTIASIAQSQTLFKKYGMIFAFFSILLIFFIFFGRFVSYININYFITQFNEIRMLSFVFIPLAILASMTIVSILNRASLHMRNCLNTSKNRGLRIKFIAVATLFTIVVAGISSTIMTIEYWSAYSRNNPHEISLSEVAAMDYLRQNTNPAIPSEDGIPYDDYQLVFTLSDVSSQALEAFSGTGSYRPYAYKGYISFDSVRPEEPLYFFNAYRTNFLYMAQRDYDSLQQINESFLGNSLQFLNKSFVDGAATVYEIPQLTPPLLDADAAIIYPNSQKYSSFYNYALMMLSEASYKYTMVMDADSGFKTKSVLVLPSDPRTPTPIFADKSFTEGWKKSSDKLECSYYGITLELSFNNSGGNVEFVSYERELPNIIDTSIYRHLVWHVLIDDMFEDPKGQIDYAGIMLYDDEAEDWYWIGAISLSNPYFTKISKGSWVDVTFDAQNNNWHRFGNVSKMKIVMRVEPYSSQKIRTDAVALYKDLGLTYESTLTPDLLGWVEKGGVLLVINSDGLGDFSDVLGLRESNTNLTVTGIENSKVQYSIPPLEVTSMFTTDPSIQSIANYTDGENQTLLAIRKIIGKGEVVYLNLEPYLLNMQSNDQDDQKVWLFNNLGALIKLINIPFQSSENADIKMFQGAFHEADFQGSVILNSDCAILPKKIEVSEFSVDPNSDQIQFNSTFSTLSNIKTYGNAKWVINAHNLTITNEGIGLYSKILIEDEFDVTIYLNPNSSVQLEVQDNFGNSKTYNIANVGSLNMKMQNDQNAEILVRTPEISANGTSNFNTLYVDKEFYNYEGNNVKMLGFLSFNAGYSNQFTLFSDFNHKETKMEVLKTGITWNEWNDVPWIEILISPENVLLVIVVLLIIPYLKKMTRKGPTTSTTSHK